MAVEESQQLRVLHSKVGPTVVLPSTENSRKVSISSNWRLYVTVRIVTFGSSIQVYSISIVNNVQFVALPWLNSTLRSRYGYAAQVGADLDVAWSTVVCILNPGALVGTVLVRHFSERFGRRGSLIINCVVTIVGAVLASIAKTLNSLELLLLGRFLLGFSIGFGCAVAGIFLTEISPTRLRGFCGGAQQVAFSLSDFLAFFVGLPQLLGTDSLWPITFGLPAIPAAIELIYLVTVAGIDSPRYLFITKGDHSRARDSVQFYQTGAEDGTTMEELRQEAESVRLRSIDRSVRLRDFFLLRRYRLPFAIALITEAALALSGFGTIISFSTDMLVAMTRMTDDEAKYVTVGIGAINFVFSLIGLWLIELVGRRPLYLVLLYGCSASMILVSIFSSLASSVIGGGVSWSDILTTIALLLHSVLYGLGSGVACVIVNEIFETDARSLAVSLTAPLQWFLLTFVTLGYLPLKAAAGVSLSFLLFIVPLLLAAVFMTLYLPETKGRSVERIVADFDK